MQRTTVVTGSASGIGAATVERLEHDGHRVIGVDLRDAEVVADLATPAGRSAMVAAITDLTGGVLDGVVANAGTAAWEPITIRLNHFGAIATLEGLRPLLARSEAPRAAATCSVALLDAVDPDLVERCLAGDEEAAVAAARSGDPRIYGSTKRSLARWLRRMAPTDGWAGAGIPLNAVAPGVVRTPMTAELLATDDGRALVDGAVPMPLGGYAEPAEVAALLAWFVGDDCSKVTGQVVFVDGGADAATRGDDVW